MIEPIKISISAAAGKSSEIFIICCDFELEVDLVKNKSQPQMEIRSTELCSLTSLFTRPSGEAVALKKKKEALIK